jgi:hypothetical protein
MNTENFLKLLRQVIKEEVNSAVKTAVQKEFQILYESLDRVSNKVIKESSVSKIDAPKKFIPKKTQTTYSANPILNEILNDTASTGFSTKDFVSILEEYNPEQLGHNDFDEWPSVQNRSMMRMPNHQTSVMPSTDIDGRPVTNVPEELKNVFERDYTSLMKAINKKKGV